MLSPRTKAGIYKLHESGRSGIRVLMFSDKKERGRYLAKKKNEAYARKQQFSFKRNEYLRVYENSLLFYELDITIQQKERINVRSATQSETSSPLERSATASSVTASVRLAVRTTTNCPLLADT